MGKIKWTYEIVSELAQGCSSRYDFQKKHKNAYNAAWQQGWLDSLFKGTRKPIGYWDVYENVYAEAKKVNNKRDFRILNDVAYRAALRNNWLATFDWFINLQESICTKEHCQNVAKLCHSVNEFRTKYKKEYNYSRINNWLPIFFEYRNGKPVKTPPRQIRLTREHCYECAKQCGYTSEMIRRFASAYNKARKMGWLKDYVWFKSPQLTLADSNARAFCIYAYIDDINNVCYIGLTKDIKRRHWQHRKPNKQGRYDVVCSYFMSINRVLPKPIVLEEDLTAADAQIRENFYIKHYTNINYTCLNIAPAGSIGSVGYKWTKENCIAEARKYTRYNDFLLNSPSCVSACRKNGWLSELTWLRRDIEYWTDEECLTTARKYEYFYDFTRENPGAYRYAKANGLLDKIRTFLEYKTIHWTDETAKVEALKYTTYNDFYLNSISAFGYAKRNGLLESFTWLQKVDRIMDIAACFEKAKEYSTLTEFKSNCPKEYQYIKNKKRLKELTWLKRKR